MLLARFAQIERKVFIPPTGETAESNVGHSFSLAMLSWFLAPQFPQLDAHKVLQLCLAHDIVEAYCGDTFSFDDQAVSTQKEREAEGLNALKQEWPDFPMLLDAIDEYESRSTPEASFVVALDRFQPILMDYLCNGRTWRDLGITYDKLLAVKDDDLRASEVAEYYNQLKVILEQQPELFPQGA